MSRAPWWTYFLIGCCVGLAAGALNLHPNTGEWWVFVVSLDVALITAAQAARS